MEIGRKRHLTVCVYGGSSSSVAAEYLDGARRLGERCAELGVDIVCGGGSTGMMAAMIDGCVAAGGHITGVLPEFMIDNSWYHRNVTRRIETPDMHSRKRRMMKDTAFAIALPGGIGTFDELCEIITWRQLGIYTGRVVIVNIGGYYDPFIRLLRHAEDEGFMNSPAASGKVLFHVVGSADEAAAMISEEIAHA